jgi:hypothetical protein
VIKVLTKRTLPLLYLLASLCLSAGQNQADIPAPDLGPAKPSLGLAKPYRSDDLLKLKRFDDAEAIVIAHFEGKGKFSNMLGAVVVTTPEGREFKIGSGFKDLQRRDRPAIGSTITYKYQGFTARGLPRFASFLRERDNY